MELLLHDSQMVDGFYHDKITMQIMWLPSKKGIEIRGNLSLQIIQTTSSTATTVCSRNMSPGDLRLIGLMFPSKSAGHTKQQNSQNIAKGCIPTSHRSCMPYTRSGPALPA